jgi:hypothetical protein
LRTDNSWEEKGEKEEDADDEEGEEWSCTE